MWDRSIAIAVIALLTVPSLASASASVGTVGTATGARVVYSYWIHTTSPSGKVPLQNYTTDVYRNLTITFTYMNVTAPLGYFGYTEKLELLNGTTVAKNATQQNVSAIFDPYNNFTYVNNLGFYPITYTDLQSGSAVIQVTSAINNTRGTPSNVSVSITRTPVSIGVNFIVDWGGIPPWKSFETYNATTGVLERADVYTNFFGVSKYFHYALLSYTLPKPGPSYTPYFGLLAVGVIVALGVLALANRKPRRERQTAKMREKFGQRSQGGQGGSTHPVLIG